MSFSIGDYVQAVEGLPVSGNGTIVEIENHGHSDFIYINWDSPTVNTYRRRYDNVIYEKVFGVHPYMITKIVSIANGKELKNTIPSNPKMRAIALKIVQLENKFKARQLAKLETKVKDARVTISRSGDITSSTEGRAHHRATVINTTVAQGTTGQIEGFFTSSEATANSF